MFLISWLFDMTAVILMICLLIKLKKRSDAKEAEISYFRYLPVSVIAMAIADALMFVVMMYEEGLTAGDIHEHFLAETEYTLTAMIISIADIYLTTVFLSFWIYFLCWHLFHDSGYIKRRYWAAVWPITVSGIVMIIGVILLVVTDRAVAVFEVSYCVFYAARLYYFILTFWLLHVYRSQNGKLRFFNVWAFFLPVLAGWLLQEFTGLNLRSLGSAIGVFLLYASVDGKRRYLDRETGLFHTGYISYLRTLIAKDQFRPCSAIVFELGEQTDTTAFSDILKKQLPAHCEPIRCTDRKIVVLTGVKVNGPLRMVLEDVREATGVEGSCTLIKKDETADAFMKRVM